MVSEKLYRNTLKHQWNGFQKDCNLTPGFRFPAIRFDTPALLSFSRRSQAHAKCPLVHEARLAKSFLVKRAQPHSCVLSVSAFGKSHSKRLSRQSQHFRKPLISTLNTGETSSNYSVKLSLSPHKSSHGNYSRLTQSINSRSRMKTSGWKGDIETPISKQFLTVFSLVRNQHQFPSRRIDFTPKTYFLRPRTCYCQQQCSQYPIFPSQARDQSFTRVAKCDKIREDIGRSGLCQSWELFLH